MRNSDALATGRLCVLGRIRDPHPPGHSQARFRGGPASKRAHQGSTLPPTHRRSSSTAGACLQERRPTQKLPTMGWGSPDHIAEHLDPATPDPYPILPSVLNKFPFLAEESPPWVSVSAAKRVFAGPVVPTSVYVIGVPRSSIVGRAKSVLEKDQDLRLHPHVLPTGHSARKSMGGAAGRSRNGEPQV